MSTGSDSILAEVPTAAASAVLVVALPQGVAEEAELAEVAGLAALAAEVVVQAVEAEAHGMLPVAGTPAANPAVVPPFSMRLMCLTPLALSLNRK